MTATTTEQTNIRTENVRKVLEGMSSGLEQEGFILHSVRFVREDGKTRAIMSYEERKD